jgi:hypothetical protein
MGKWKKKVPSSSQLVVLFYLVSMLNYSLFNIKHRPKKKTLLPVGSVADFYRTYKQSNAPRT